MTYSGYRLPENHFCLESCADIQEICKPLARLFPFHHFWYSRTYKDGSSAILTTHLKLMQNLDETFITGANDEGHYVGSQYLLQPDIENIFIPSDMLKLYAQSFEIDNQLLVFKEHDQYTDLYSFVSEPNTKGIYSFYMSHIDLFELFIVGFQEKAEKLIFQAQKNKIFVPKYDGDLSCSLAEDCDVDLFKKELQISRYKIEFNKKVYYLTVREFDVVSCLARGLSVKESAKKLGLSPRTVEFYFGNIKAKLGCYSKSQVVEAFWLCGLGNVSR